MRPDRLGTFPVVIAHKQRVLELMAQLTPPRRAPSSSSSQPLQPPLAAPPSALRTRADRPIHPGAAQAAGRAARAISRAALVNDQERSEAMHNRLHERSAASRRRGWRAGPGRR